MGPEYAMAVERESEHIPEHLLIAAVIQQALDDLQRPVWKPIPDWYPNAIRNQRIRERKKHEQIWDTARRTARTWLLSESDTDANRRFSIQWCCRMVGQDCGRFQQRVRQRIQAGVW